MRKLRLSLRTMEQRKCIYICKIRVITGLVFLYPPLSAFLPDSLNAKYFLQTAKITGFGGTLDNKTEQLSSCRVKEGMVKVSLALAFLKV